MSVVTPNGRAVKLKVHVGDGDLLEMPIVWDDPRQVYLSPITKSVVHIMGA